MGVKYLDVFNPDFFYQHRLVNNVFRSVAELVHPRAEEMSDNFRHFAGAMHSNRGFGTLKQLLKQ